MGCWGTGHLESDDAHDFLYEVEEKGVAAIAAALHASKRADYLEAPEGVRALAAAALVAASSGDSKYDFKDDAALDIVLKLSEDAVQITSLRPAALAACKRVTGPESELEDLWLEQKENGDYEDWRNKVEDVIRSLST